MLCNVSVVPRLRLRREFGRVLPAVRCGRPRLRPVHRLTRWGESVCVGASARRASVHFMRPWLRVVLVGGFCLAIGRWAFGAGSPADGQFTCLSIRFHRGTEPFDLFALDLSSLPGRVNGELFPVWGADPYTHGAILTLTDLVWFEEVPGNLLLEIPPGDNDGNGVPDFFEVRRAVQWQGNGVYQLAGYGSGAVEARWTRNAGDPVGTCVLNLKVNPFQSLAVFTHTFELLEYRGTLSYTNRAGGIEGHVELGRTGRPEVHWTGPVRLLRSPETPTETLILFPGAWTNELDQLLWYPTNHLFRDPRAATNYAGYFDFEDGEPATPEPDYLAWIWTVTDPNDLDRDGIPDLSDDPGSAPDTLRLWIRKVGDELELGVAGAPPGRCQVFETATLENPFWQPVLTVPLTNASQAVMRVRPGASSRFWRVQLE